MSIKKFFIGMAILLSVSLFVIGCPTEAADGVKGPQGSTGLGAGTLPASASVELFDAYFSRLDTVFLTAAPMAGTFKVPSKKTLVVVGNVTLASNTVINAFEGTLDVVDGGFVGSNGVIIVPDNQKATVQAKAPYLNYPEYVAAIGTDPEEITEDVVLPSLTIGTGGVAAEDFATFAGTTYTVYVAGNTGFSGTVVLTTEKLVALGGVTAKGALTVTNSQTIGKITALDALTLTGVSNLSELDTATYEVTSPDATVTLAKLDSGAGGKLKLTGAVTGTTITAGTGNIAVAPTVDAPTAFASGATFGNTGLTTFAKGVTVAVAGTFDGPVAFADTFGFTDVAVAFNNTVSFAGNVTRTTGGALTFGGNVTLAKTKTLTLASADIVTLEAGAAINAALSAGDANVVLTPADGAVLTVDAGEAKKITLGTAGLTVSSGTLTVADGAELVASAVALTVAAEAVLDITGVVNLTGVGSVVLTAASSDGALLTGTGKLTAQATEIVGGTDGWQAVGASGTVTIASTGTAGSSTITGSTGVLTAQGEGATITQLAVTDSNLTATANTVINFDTDGALVLKAGSNKAKITLAATTAILKFGTGVATGSASNTKLAAAFTSLTFGTSVTGKTTILNSVSGLLTQIIGAGATNTLEGAATGPDVTLDATKVVDSEV
jgi:hypothetical protein